MIGFGKRLLSLVIPGLVIQAVITGGGYATGREIVEYCVKYGNFGFGVLGIAFVGFGSLFYVAGDIARRHQAYEYREWSRSFLGTGWWLIDILFVAMAVLVCAIVLSGAAEVLAKVLLIPAAGAAGVSVIVAAGLIALGRRAILATKLLGAGILTLGYLTFGVVCVSKLGPPALPQVPDGGGFRWIGGGIEYVSYNIVAIPACLYAFRGLSSSRDIAASAFLGALLVVLPMAVMAAAIVAGGDMGRLDAPAPLHEAVLATGSPGLIGAYYLILGWTLFDTAVGLVGAFLDRIDSHFGGNMGLGGLARGTIATIFLVGSFLLSKLGIIALVAKGYGWMAYGFFLLMVAPMVSVNAYQALRDRDSK